MKPKTIKRLTETQRSYLAGMIDGEGSICITKRNDRRLGRLGYCYRPVLHVASTHESVLKTLRQWTGLGQAHLFDDARTNRKARWQWMIWSNQAVQIVESVLPYLIIKKDQAKLFIQFVRVTRKNNQPGSKGLSDAAWARQDKIYAKMKSLNGKYA